jgi:hypothetical protein
MSTIRDGRMGVKDTSEMAVERISIRNIVHYPGILLDQYGT